VDERLIIGKVYAVVFPTSHLGAVKRGEQIPVEIEVTENAGK